MRSLKKIIAVCIFSMLIINYAAAQQDTTIKIKTSGQCDKCKARIEEGLSFEKGVKAVNFDVKSQVVTVKYNSQKTSSDKIKTAITKIGYDADEKMAEEKAYNKLPKCCKKGSSEHH